MEMHGPETSTGGEKEVGNRLAQFVLSHSTETPRLTSEEWERQRHGGYLLRQSGELVPLDAVDFNVYRFRDDSPNRDAYLPYLTFAITFSTRGNVIYTIEWDDSDVPHGDFAEIFGDDIWEGLDYDLAAAVVPTLLDRLIELEATGKLVTEPTE